MGEKPDRREANLLKKILILSEGFTEESFIRDVLHPHLGNKGVLAIPVIVATKRVKAGADFKGGIISYGKFKKEIKMLLADTSAVCVSTMIDYYGLPGDFPGREAQSKESIFERAYRLEQAFARDVDHRRFVPYLSLHEFEALLFSSPAEIAGIAPEQDAENKLLSIKRSFSSPEEINDNPQTHPAARITGLIPAFRKSPHSPLIAGRIGLAQIRNECRHFDAWLTKLEEFGE